MSSMFKTFTAGVPLTASELNNYLMKQAVIVCDSSADYPASPTEGMHVYDKALEQVLFYSGSGWVTVGVYGEWVDFTPTITQGSGVTKTVNYARYARQGSVVTVAVRMTVIGSGTSSSPVTVSVPVTAAQAGSMAVGSASLYDASANVTYGGIAVLSSTSAAAFVPTSADQGAFLGQGVFTAALSASDVITMTVTYEAA